jgi:hypothetical protein
MARTQITVLLTAFILLSFSGSALDFNVEVQPKPEAGIFQPSSDSTGAYFNSSVAIENSGSVGCEFRFKGDVEQGDQKVQRYSSVYRVWPGDLTDAEFFYIPINYTGQVDVNLSMQYCDREEHVDSYSFESNETILPNKTIESKTLEVDDREAVVSIDQEEGMLIPQNYPPYWKVGSVEIKNSTANIEYDPTLFRKGEEIVYTVVENQTVKGKTTVVLEDEETRFEEFVRKLSNWF